MQQTKLGIKVGLLGAMVFLTGLFGNLLLTVIVAGYILLIEDNEWLRKSAVKAVTVVVIFSFAATVLNLIPDTIGTVHSIVSIFGGRFSILVLSNIVSAVVSVLGLLEKVLLIILGVKALHQGSITIPIVDKLINKYMG